MAGFQENDAHFATKALHAGQEPEQWNSMAVVPPIFMSTTFKQDAPADFRKYEYGRTGNPTRDVLETCLASLDGAKHAMTFPAAWLPAPASPTYSPPATISSPWTMSTEAPTVTSGRSPPG